MVLCAVEYSDYPSKTNTVGAGSTCVRGRFRELFATDRVKGSIFAWLTKIFTLKCRTLKSYGHNLLTRPPYKPQSLRKTNCKPMTTFCIPRNEEKRQLRVGKPGVKLDLHLSKVKTQVRSLYSSIVFR